MKAEATLTREEVTQLERDNLIILFRGDPRFAALLVMARRCLELGGSSCAPCNNSDEPAKLGEVPSDDTLRAVFVASDPGGYRGLWLAGRSSRDAELAAKEARIAELERRLRIACPCGPNGTGETCSNCGAEL